MNLFCSELASNDHIVIHSSYVSYIYNCMHRREGKSGWGCTPMVIPVPLTPQIWVSRIVQLSVKTPMLMPDPTVCAGPSLMISTSAINERVRLSVKRRAVELADFLPVETSASDEKVSWPTPPTKTRRSESAGQSST